MTAGLTRPGRVFGQFQYLSPPEAVYPDEAIQAHLAFLTRRRALRPSEERCVPTDEEWTEFLDHFEVHKVDTGTCGRAFGTPCIRERRCLRCSMHWPSPTQRSRIAEIHDNLIARTAEAEHEGRHGEAERLNISLAGARDKLAQIDRRSTQPTRQHRHARLRLRSPAHQRTEVNTPTNRSEDHFKFRECATWSSPSCA